MEFLHVIPLSRLGFVTFGTVLQGANKIVPAFLHVFAALDKILYTDLQVKPLSKRKFRENWSSAVKGNFRENWRSAVKG
jgi:hypothetical protein